MKLSAQLSGFALVGLVATLFQYTLMWILLRFVNFEVVFSSTISYATSAALNYSLNYHFVFGAKARHLKSLPRFLIIVIVGLVLNATLMKLMMNLNIFNWFISQIVATALVMVCNFLLSKYWAFKNNDCI